jgi:hypothetical protein
MPATMASGTGKRRSVPRAHCATCRGRTGCRSRTSWPRPSTPASGTCTKPPPARYGRRPGSAMNTATPASASRSWWRAGSVTSPATHWIRSPNRGYGTRELGAATRTAGACVAALRPRHAAAAARQRRNVERGGRRPRHGLRHAGAPRDPDRQAIGSLEAPDRLRPRDAGGRSNASRTVRRAHCMRRRYRSGWSPASPATTSSRYVRPWRARASATATRTAPGSGRGDSCSGGANSALARRVRTGSCSGARVPRTGAPLHSYLTMVPPSGLSRRPEPPRTRRRGRARRRPLARIRPAASH